MPEQSESEIPYAEEDGRLEKMLEKHCSILSEHFDSVRIVATVNRGDGVYGMVSRGAGNYFAQYGAIREWVTGNEQQTRNHAG